MGLKGGLQNRCRSGAGCIYPQSACGGSGNLRLRQSLRTWKPAAARASKDSTYRTFCRDAPREVALLYAGVGARSMLTHRAWEYGRFLAVVAS